MDNAMLIATLLENTIAYEKSCVKRIAHMVKVHGYARTLGILEGLDEKTLLTLEAGAIVHDVGIQICEKKYGGMSPGNLQELEGPPLARKLLEALPFAPDIVDRVAYLVGHHHTYTDIQGKDYQILVESDFLVNFEEKNVPLESCQSVYNKIFATESGKRFMRLIFTEHLL